MVVETEDGYPGMYPEDEAGPDPRSQLDDSPFGYLTMEI